MKLILARNISLYYWKLYRKVLVEIEYFKASVFHTSIQLNLCSTHPIKPELAGDLLELTECRRIEGC